jgi:excisionase family DNA binding protein
MPDNADAQYCGITEAASLLGIGVTTTQRLVDEGTLLAWKTQGGHRRILRDSIEALRGKQIETSMRLTLLLSDNHIDERKAFATELAQCNLPLQIRTSEDGVDALIQLERLRPDLWIIDPSFVDIDGWKAVLRVARYPEMLSMSIVICTASKPDSSLKSQALTQGVIVYEKPFPLAQIQGVIADRLARKIRQREL